jgi:hypothetical protein
VDDFYTKDRPRQETAHPRGTVPRPLPDHLEAGYTLQQPDVEALQIMNERRNAQLRFLYERELEFSEAISGTAGSISFRLGDAEVAVTEAAEMIIAPVAVSPLRKRVNTTRFRHPQTESGLRNNLDRHRVETPRRIATRCRANSCPAPEKQGLRG